jgi:hypothetical protein
MQPPTRSSPPDLTPIQLDLARDAEVTERKRARREDRRWYATTVIALVGAVGAVLPWVTRAELPVGAVVAWPHAEPPPGWSLLSETDPSAVDRARAIERLRSQLPSGARWIYRRD